VIVPEGAYFEDCGCTKGVGMDALRVVVADDHRLMLDALRLAFEEVEGMDLVGETNEGRKLLPLVAREKPDVVLLDFRMPDMDGLACLDKLKSQHPEITVVMLSAEDDPALVQEALRRGASAYVLKQIDPRDLPSAIRQAVEGTVYQVIGGEEAEDEPDSAFSGLSPKERAVLTLISRGLSNKEIARELWVSEQTVKFHLTNIYRKLGVANRTEAARAAFRFGLARPYETSGPEQQAGGGRS
jgi:DNA-binding NarL/FixJ family response regulator